MTTSATSLIGRASVGAIQQGVFASGSGWLPCDGTDTYLSADYPALPKSGLEAYCDDFAQITMPSSAQWASIDGAEGGVLLAIPNSGTACAYSADGGATWTATTCPITLANYSMAIHGPGTGKVLVTNSSTTVAVFNTTTFAWSTVTVAKSVYKGSFVSGLFVLLAAGSAARDYISSPDAATWTSRTYGTTFSYAITHGQPTVVDGVLHVPEAYYSSGGGGAVYYTTSDGITWGAVTPYAAVGSALSGLTVVEPLPDGRLLLQANSGLYLSANRGLSLTAFLAGVASVGNETRVAPELGQSMLANVYLARRVGSALVSMSTPGTIGYSAAVSYNSARSFKRSIQRPVATASDGYTTYSAPYPQHFGSVIGSTLFLMPSSASTSVLRLRPSTTKFRTPDLARGQHFSIKAK